MATSINCIFCLDKGCPACKSAKRNQIIALSEARRLRDESFADLAERSEGCTLVSKERDGLCKVRLPYGVVVKHVVSQDSHVQIGTKGHLLPMEGRLYFIASE